MCVLERRLVLILCTDLVLWQFVSTSLPTCQNLPIIVESYNSDNSTHGTPPYYMMAFEVNGVPTTTFIGTDENNLTWQVNHAPSESHHLIM